MGVEDRGEPDGRYEDDSMSWEEMGGVECKGRTGLDLRIVYYLTLSLKYVNCWNGLVF